MLPIRRNVTLLKFAANVTTRMVNEETGLTIYNSRICGFVSYCKDSAYTTCNNTTINSCEDCNQAAAAFFVFLICSLVLAIFIGNTSIIAVGNYHRRKGKISKMDICKSSLAIADLFAGVQLLVVTMYNFSWTGKLTSFELNAEQLALRGSRQAVFGGILYMFIYTSSLYHLFYIGVQRIYAIHKPIQYKHQSKLQVRIGLATVWFFAISSATLPVWFPANFTYDYHVPIFFFLPSPQTVTGDNSLWVSLTILFYVVPYVLMTFATVFCGALLKVHYGKKLSKSRPSRPEAVEAVSRHKIHGFVSIAIMQLGFTMTTIPIVVTAGLFHSGYLNCFNYSTPYSVCFHLGSANSLVNVIVYSFRDKKFRMDLKKLFSL